MSRSDSPSAPRALFRSGMALVDLVILPLLALAFLTVLGMALASLGIAAGGINFVLGLAYLPFFPTFPAPARVLTGLSLLAFSVFLISLLLLLWHYVRKLWNHFWSWHRSAWQGTFVKLQVLPGSSDRARGAHPYMPFLKLSALVFAGLFALSFTLMMLLAAGPFWHAWLWFS